jgi:hypothetical protein
VIIVTQQTGTVYEGGRVAGVIIQHLEIRGLAPETAFESPG